MVCEEDRAVEDVLSMMFPKGTPASLALEMLRTAALSRIRTTLNDH